MATANQVMERCQQAGLNFWLASRAAIELKEELKPQASVEEADRLVIKKLNSIDAEAASQFESFHKIAVRTSRGTLEGFNRQKITASITKETRLPSIIAEEISREVEEDVRRLQLRNISAPFIREMINAKLVNRKLLAAKMKYTRVGLPVHDVSERLEKEAAGSPHMLTAAFGEAILQEYALTKILPPEISELYLNADIDIPRLEGFTICPLSVQNDLRFVFEHGVKLPGVVATGSAKYAEVAASHAARALTMSCNYASGGVGFDFFNFFIAPYLRRKNIVEMRQVAQTFLYELNRGYRAPHAFTVSMSTFLPKYLRSEPAIGPSAKQNTYADYEEEASAFLRAFLEVLLEGDHTKTPFTWPKVCIKYKNKLDLEKQRLKIPKPCFFINQSKYENIGMLYGNALSGDWKETLGTGVSQAVSLNLPKAAFETHDENAFFERLGELIDAAGKTVILKRELLRKKRGSGILNFLNRQENNKAYFNYEKTVGHVFFKGMHEAALLLEPDASETAAIAFSGKILRFAKKKLKEQEALLHAGDYWAQIPRFEKHNQRLGIKQTPALFTKPENIAELQAYAPAGLFIKTNDVNLLKNKDFIFTRLE